MVVKVRGRPIDATELRNVESIEDLIAANGLQRSRIGEDGAGIARFEDDARSMDDAQPETSRRRVGDDHVVRLRVRRSVERRGDAVLEILHLCRSAVTSPAKVIELFLPLPLDRRQRWIEVGQRTARIDRRRQFPDLRR